MRQHLVDHGNGGPGVGRQSVVLVGIHQPGRQFGSIPGYAQQLQAYWAPPPKINVSSFVNHADTLLDIWKQVAGNKDLRSLDNALTAGCEIFCKDACVTGTAANMPPPEQRYVIQQMLQLMENVFLDLDLAHHDEHPDNIGWMQLFRIWRANKVWSSR